MIDRTTLLFALLGFRVLDVTATLMAGAWSWWRASPTRAAVPRVG